MCGRRRGRDAAPVQKMQGFGDGLTLAVEMAVIPLILAVLGLAADRRLGTLPLFTIVLLVVGMAGGFARSYYAYRYQCELEEEKRPWDRPGR
jgi:F0F1-type ATP synthase assembly protein I